MISISIGELQKNSSILTNLTQTFQIVDKRKKQILAMVYPTRRQSMVDRLAGKYKNIAIQSEKTFCQIKEESTRDAMRDKYGLST